MFEDVFSIKIGGSAGQGIKSSGLMLSKLATRSGYHVYNHIEYPSLIRGGHNVMQINISSQEVTGPFNKVDFLIALNQETIDVHHQELISTSGVLFDVDKNYNLTNISTVEQYAVPLAVLAKDVGGREIACNSVALGAAAGILGSTTSELEKLVRDEFGDKGEGVVETNLKAVRAGYDYVLTNYSAKIKRVLSNRESMDSLAPRMVIDGNEASALGAISAGMQFAAIYPMSPISPILAVLAEHQEKFGYIYKQPEDEISAINMALGASFAGARSMTATSGGGFCLMTEGYGLAGMTETPVVIIEGMRGGPATGLPTWSGQGDLRFVLHAHQGAFPKIVLTPGDAKEAFELTMEAFNLAERYQTPVVVLIDKNICDNHQSFPLFECERYVVDRGKAVNQVDKNYKRYKFELDGISARASAGSGNFFISNSDEHDEIGYSTEEIAMRNSQMQKRMQKLETCKQRDMKDPQLYGPEKSDLTIVSWGSCKGPIIQSIKNFPKVNYVHITWMNPFPSEKLADMLKKSKKILGIEANYSGQLMGLIREKTGIEVKNTFFKDDGRPFFVEELVEKIQDVLKGGKK